MHDAISRQNIMNPDSADTIHPHDNRVSRPSNINPQGLLLQKRLQLNMYRRILLPRSKLMHMSMLIIQHVRIQGVFRNKMVLQQGMQALFAAGREEILISKLSQTVKGCICRGECCTAGSGFVGQLVDQTGLFKAEGESAEMPRQEFDDCAGIWRWNEWRVDVMKNAIASNLMRCQ
jgi:hypothetical protein